MPEPIRDTRCVWCNEPGGDRGLLMMGVDGPYGPGMCHAKCLIKHDEWWQAEGKEHHSIKLRTMLTAKAECVPVLEVPPEFLAACCEDKRVEQAVYGFLRLMRLILEDSFERRALVSGDCG